MADTKYLPRYISVDDKKYYDWKQNVNPYVVKGEQNDFFPKYISQIFSIFLSDLGPFTWVGSTMLYHNQTPSTYDEAIYSCAKYGAHLVEVFTEKEWRQVKSKQKYFIALGRH